jgi:hypothetical protein
MPPDTGYFERLAPQVSPNSGKLWQFSHICWKLTYNKAYMKP